MELTGEDGREVGENECSQEVVSLAYVKWVKVLFWYPMAAILDCFFYFQLQTKNNITKVVFSIY